MSRAVALLNRTLEGKYLLKRLIGVGGMGAVYEGLHVSLNKRVAVKLIAPELMTSPASSRRFLQEARSASAVESEHIVQIFDVGADPDCGLYMVMEYLTGEDLGQRIKREGRLDAPFVVNFAWHIARALAKAHGAGIVHRDIKPANLFLTEREDGTSLVKLLDFGLATVLSAGAKRSDPTASITGGSMTVGTPHYMSPEQAQGMPVDRRTDVWSFGAVLYEALAGRPPYKPQPTYERTIIELVTRKPPKLSIIAPWVPAQVAEVVHYALEHDLSARIQDFTSFATLIRLGLPEAFAPSHKSSTFRAAHRLPVPTRPRFSPPPEPVLPVLPGAYLDADIDDLTDIERSAVDEIRGDLHAVTRRSSLVPALPTPPDEPEAEETSISPSPLLIAGVDWGTENDATTVGPSPLSRPPKPRR